MQRIIINNNAIYPAMKCFFSGIIVLILLCCFFSCGTEKNPNSSINYKDSSVILPLSEMPSAPTEVEKSGILDSSNIRLSYPEFLTFLPSYDVIEKKYGKEFYTGDLSYFKSHFVEPKAREYTNESDHGWWGYEERRDNRSFVGFGGSENKKLGIPMMYSLQFVEGKMKNNSLVGRWVHYLYNEQTRKTIYYASYTFPPDYPSENIKSNLLSFSFYALNDSLRKLMNKENEVLTELLTDTLNLHIGLKIDSIIYDHNGNITGYVCNEFEEVFNKFDNSNEYKMELDCVAKYKYAMDENGEFTRRRKGFRIDQKGYKIIDNYDENGFSPITLKKAYYCITVSHANSYDSDESRYILQDKKMKSQFNDQILEKNDLVVFNSIRPDRETRFDFNYKAFNGYSKYYYTHSVDQIYKDILLKLYYKLECAYEKSHGEFLALSDYSACEIDFFCDELKERTWYYSDCSLKSGRCSNYRSENMTHQMAYFGRYYYFIKGSKIAVFNDF
jgi:hypothetical protein